MTNQAPSEALLQATATAPDFIVETAGQLEKLEKAEALALVPSFIDAVDLNYFKLGGVLSVIQSNGWAKDEGFDTFKAFVEVTYGLNYRKAMYLISIYNGLVESGVPWAKVKDIGWTKLKEVVPFLTAENADEWVGRCNSMTVLQLQEYISKLKSGQLSHSGEPVPDAPSSLSTMTFKVHADQKENIKSAVEKAKGEASTEFDSVALDAICLNYLSGGKSMKMPSLKSVMEKSNPEEVLETFEKLWPNIEVKVTMPG